MLPEADPVRKPCTCSFELSDCLGPVVVAEFGKQLKEESKEHVRILNVLHKRTMVCFVTYCHCPDLALSCRQFRRLTLELSQPSAL